MIIFFSSTRLTPVIGVRRSTAHRVRKIDKRSINARISFPEKIFLVYSNNKACTNNNFALVCI